MYQLKYDLSFPKYNDVIPSDSPPEEVFILRRDEDGNWPADELLENPAEYVNHDTIATIIPLTRSADVSGRAPGAGQYPTRPDGDKDDIYLDSGEEIRLLIRVTEEDYFTLPSNPMQFKVSAKDKAQAVLFTVNLSINNDFQDPITDPEHDALLQGESVIFLENDPDNNTSFVFDFNPVDADSYPNHELRPDYNASESGNPTNGGSIFYLLGGDDAGLFTVDENGSVFFKTPPE